MALTPEQKARIQKAGLYKPEWESTFASIYEKPEFQSRLALEEKLLKPESELTYSDIMESPGYFGHTGFGGQDIGRNPNPIYGAPEPSSAAAGRFGTLQSIKKRQLQSANPLQAAMAEQILKTSGLAGLNRAQQEYELTGKVSSPDLLTRANYQFPTSEVRQDLLGKLSQPAATQQATQGVTGATKGNTLAEIQSSPIPQFNSQWGANYPGGRVNFALAHRQNIYNAVNEILGRPASAQEVNWWLQNDPNIDSIKNKMKSSVEYQQKQGQQQGGQPQGDSALKSEVDQRAGTTPRQELVNKILEASKAQPTGEKLYGDIRTEVGLPQSEAQLAEKQRLLDQMLESQQRGIYGEGQRTIPMPFISGRQRAIQELGSLEQGVLQREIERLGGTKSEKEALLKTLLGLRGEDVGRESNILKEQLKMQEPEYEAERKKQEALLTPDTQVVTAGGRELLINKDTGEVIKDLGGAYKGTGGGVVGNTPEGVPSKIANAFFDDLNAFLVDFGTGRVNREQIWEQMLSRYEGQLAPYLRNKVGDWIHSKIYSEEGGLFSSQNKEDEDEW